MPRSVNNPASRQRRKKILKQAKGYRGARSKLIRQAMETVRRAYSFAYKHRRLQRRSIRSLWITRLSAACKQFDISYSKFMHGLTVAGIVLDRKLLSDMAVNDKEGFAKIVEMAKSKVA